MILKKISHRKVRMEIIKKIGLGGALASIIALGIMIFTSVSSSTGETKQAIETSGNKSPGVQSKGDVKVTYGNAHHQPVTQNQNLHFEININGKSLPISAAAVNRTTEKSIDIHLPGEKHDRELSFNEVKQLANDYGLFKAPPPNAHLSFLDGDISYWFEQGLTESRCKFEFAARRAALDAASENGINIRDQGTLSWAAQQIMAAIISARQR